MQIFVELIVEIYFKILLTDKLLTFSSFFGIITSHRMTVKDFQNKLRKNFPVCSSSENLMYWGLDLRLGPGHK